MVREMGHHIKISLTVLADIPLKVTDRNVRFFMSVIFNKQSTYVKTMRHSNIFFIKKPANKN